MIETFEARTLLSATISPVVVADVAVIKAQALVLRSELIVDAKQAGADLKTIVADLKRLKTLKADRSLVNTLVQQERPDLANVKQEARALVATGSASIRKIVGDERALLHKPTNVILQAKLAADISTLQLLAPAAQQTLVASTTLAYTDAVTNLNAIGGANSSDAQTQTDVATTKSNLFADGQTLAASGTTLLVDVQALINALSA